MLVANSRAAIELASPTLPVKNQLIAKVSRVPKVRQLIALRTDRECVSPPRNKITLGLPNRSKQLQSYHGGSRPRLTSSGRPQTSAAGFWCDLVHMRRARTGLPQCSNESSPGGAKWLLFKILLSRSRSP